jgi:cytochrome P450
MSNPVEVGTPGTVPASPDPAAEHIFYRVMTQPVDDPAPDFRELREAAPALLTSDGSLVLSRHADCNAALRHRGLGKGDEWLKLQMSRVPSNRVEQVMKLLQRSMILTNPPDHTRLRRLVSSAFTVRHVDGLRATAGRWIEALLDDLAADPGADFMGTLAIPLPVNVIAELLGIPEADRTGLVPKIHELGLLMEPAATADEIGTGVAAQEHLANYLTDLLAAKRRHAGDDLLSRLATDNARNGLDDTEMVATALLLFGAGNTPTANLLGNGLYLLLTNPDQWQRLRADPALVPTAVEEILRYDSPSQFDFLSALEPVTFAGTTLEPGQTVITLLGAANHDPERFEAPERFDVGRTENAHLSFAAGIHFCLGAPLARMQAEVFLHRLLHEDVSLSDEPRRHPGIGNRGFDHLPVILRR